MSTATLDAPQTDLPDMASTFSTTLSGLKAEENGTPSEPKQPEVKTTPEVKTEAKAEPVKTDKKRSALEAAVAEETPEVVDESAKVFEAAEPSKDNWAKARETFKTQSQKIKEYEAKLSQASAPAPEVLTELKTLKEERQRLKEENDRMRDNIIALDVRFDPSVQDKISGREKQVSRLAETIKENGSDAQSFIDAMALPLSKRASALDAILENITSSRARTTIEAKLAQIELVDEQLDEQLNNPHKTFEELKRERDIQAKSHQEKVEQFKAATFENTLKELPKISRLMKAVPSDVEGADEFNAELQRDLERAPQLLDVEPKDAAVAAFKASRYDSVEKMVIKSQARIAELEAALAKMEGAEPGYRGGGKATPKQDWERPAAEIYHEALAAKRGS